MNAINENIVTGEEALKALLEGKTLVLADAKILVITVSDENIGLKLSINDFKQNEFKVVKEKK